MRRYWLLLSQAVTVFVAAYLVVAAFQPQWLQRDGAAPTAPAASVQQAAREAVTPLAVPSPAGSFRDAAEKASPSVVSISTMRLPQRHPYADHPLFRYYFGDPGPAQPQTGLGSGVIISSDGIILTNNHVIQGASEVEVQLSDSRSVRAKVVGADPDTDLAVLRITLDRLPAITLGDSDNLKVGDQVLAIGNPFGVGMTVTAGIVSALRRSQLGINTFEDFIQTDAAINPGNSGGALVDVNGHLVGINTAIYSRSGGNMGIGFAIPVSTAKQVVEGLVKEGVVTRGWIGVQAADLTPELKSTLNVRADKGVLIAGVQRGGPADRGGLQPGDVVTEIAGTRVDSLPELLTAVTGLKPGTPARIKVRRGKDDLELSVVPAKRPPQPGA